MNLFREQKPITENELQKKHYLEIEKKKTDQWNEFVNMRVKVRKWLQEKNPTENIEEITKELLLQGKPDYQRTKDLFTRFVSIIQPNQKPEN